MTIAVRMTAFLMLILGVQVVHGEQGNIVWLTAPPTEYGRPAVTYAPSRRACWLFRHPRREDGSRPGGIGRHL